MFLSLESFIQFANNRQIVIADFEARKSRLDTMLYMQANGDTCPLLEKWIANAYTQLEVIRPLYVAALYANNLPMDEITVLYVKIKELKNE